MKTFESKNSEDFRFATIVAKQRVFQRELQFFLFSDFDFSEALCGQQVNVAHHVDDIQALCQGSRWKTSIHELQSVTMRSLQQQRKDWEDFQTFADFYFSHIFTTNLQLIYILLHIHLYYFRSFTSLK